MLPLNLTRVSYTAMQNFDLPRAEHELLIFYTFMTSHIQNYNLWLKCDMLWFHHKGSFISISFSTTKSKYNWNAKCIAIDGI